MSKDNETVIENAVGDLSAEDINGPPRETKPPKIPVLTTEIVLQVIIDLQEPELNGGLLGIASKNSISHAQVKQIRRAAQDRLGELAGVGVGEGELEGEE